MKLKIPRYVALLIFLLALNVNAQDQNNKQPLPLVNYNQNVDAPLKMAERQKLEEVYGDKLHQYVLSKPQRLKSIKNILRNRVEIREISNPQDQKDCELLSEVSLFDYYVPNLKRDAVFNANNFNPLKYNFEFYSRGAHMYRVDNTNYFIIIKSQHHQ
ncbi:MAG: hypothetical protein KJO77_03530 [Bacteroidia bacterium]|nr:hypothetical protein [Bacteroidia bacterium]NND53095.1 hypothetical protein [Flavobacteriaceae bacterium]